MATRSRRGHWLLVVAAAVGAAALPVAASSRASTDVPEPRAPVAGATPSISGDGQLVAFAGAPSAADGRSSTVWLHDRRTGTVSELTTPVNGVRLGNSVAPAISADGCIVAVVTEMAYDLYRDEDTGQRWDVYRLVLPACTLVPSGWELVSAVSHPGAPSQADDGVDPGDRPAVSGSGAAIAYTTRFGTSKDLQAVVVADMTVPVDQPGHLARVAGTPQATPDTTFRYRGLREPSISADGSVIAFTSDARSDLAVPTWDVGAAAGAFAASQVYVWDRSRTDPTTAVLAASAASGHANGEARAPALSSDGRYVAFESTSTDLVAGATTPSCAATCVSEVYRVERAGGSVALVSRAPSDPSTAAQPGAPVGADLGATRPAISADGSQVAFVSRATNLMPTNPSRGGEVADGDVIVAEVATGVLRRASTQADGITPAPAANGHPQMSATGRVVVFDSLVASLFPSPGVPAAPAVDPASPTVSPTASPTAGRTARQVVAIEVQPVLALSDLDVGTVAVGVAGPEWRVAAVNRGPSTFVPATVTSSNPDFAITGGTCQLGLPVAPGDFCTVLVVLTPSKPGRITGKVTVAEGGARPASVSSVLSGAGGEPILAPQGSGSALLAPTVVGRRSDPVELGIENVGLLPTRVRTAEVVGVDPHDFAVDASGCTKVTLDSGTACQVRVSFTPTAAGDRTAVVNVVTSTGQYTSLLVIGTGVYQPTMTVPDGAVQAGRSVEVTGAGFPAGVPVALSWSDDPSHAVVVTADGAGGFTTSFPVSPVERGGDRQLVAQAPDAIASVAVDVTRVGTSRSPLPRRPGR